MKRRELMILSGVIATLALAGTSSAAGLLGTGIGANGGTKASVNANVGGTSVSANVGSNAASGVKANVAVGSGNGTAASANANIGGATGTNARANVNLGGATGTNARANVNLGGATTTAKANVATDPLAANADIRLGLGGSRTLRATVDLNGDGLINGEDDVLVALDVNGDGILNVLDDVNADGLLSVLDLQGVDLGNLTIPTIELPSVTELPSVSASIGTDPTSPGPGFAPPPGGRDPLPGFRDPLGPQPNDISRVLDNLDDDEVASLKLKCADVLGNPGGFDAATVSVCRVLASL